MSAPSVFRVPLSTLFVVTTERGQRGRYIGPWAAIPGHFHAVGCFNSYCYTVEASGDPSAALFGCVPRTRSEVYPVHIGAVFSRARLGGPTITETAPFLLHPTNPIFPAFPARWYAKGPTPGGGAIGPNTEVLEGFPGRVNPSRRRSAKSFDDRRNWAAVPIFRPGANPGDHPRRSPPGCRYRCKYPLPFPTVPKGRGGVVSTVAGFARTIRPIGPAYRGRQNRRAASIQPGGFSFGVPYYPRKDSALLYAIVSHISRKRSAIRSPYLSAIASPPKLLVMIVGSCLSYRREINSTSGKNSLP